MIELGILGGMLLVTFAIGKFLETSHYKTIREREQNFLNKPALTIKMLPDTYRISQTTLAVGSVVISVDYFKSFIANLRLLVGGELRSYSSLIDRGRREAILRMKQSCPNADLYLNTRLETSTISMGGGKRTIGSIEIFCYATAVLLEKNAN
jgi:uncharacterized protein YbjQ (UPF0145 family)